MPTLIGSRIPPPRDGKEFEEVALAAIRALWNSPTFDRNGRSGQAQDGVDLCGPDDLGRMVGVQCKATATLTIDVIRAEAEKSDGFVPTLRAFYVATTLAADAALQREVRKYSEERIQAGRCPVGLLSWETISGEILKTPPLLAAHYPQLAPQPPDNGGGLRMLSALDIGFLGTNLKYRMELLFGEWGWLSQENPHKFSHVTLQLESCGDILLSEPLRSEFRQTLRDLLATALRLALGEARSGETWSVAEAFAIRVEAFVRSLEVRLPSNELPAYTAGRLLAVWDQLEERRLPHGLVDGLLEAASHCGLDAALAAEITARASEYGENQSVMIIHIPGELYGAFRKQLRSKEAVRAVAK